MRREAVATDLEQCSRFVRPESASEQPPDNNASQPSYSTPLINRGSLDQNYDPFNSVLADAPICLTQRAITA